MADKLYDSEYKVMDIIWANEPVSAKRVGELAAESYGWNKNTTYTVLTKLTAKGVITRSDPGFICSSALSRGDARRRETDELVNKLYGGSKKALFSSLINGEGLTSEELDELKRLVDKL